MSNSDTNMTLEISVILASFCENEEREVIKELFTENSSQNIDKQLLFWYKFLSHEDNKWRLIECRKYRKKNKSLKRKLKEITEENEQLRECGIKMPYSGFFDE